MGTPLPFNPAGVLCTNCWSPGFPFAPGPTPQIIIARFFDWSPGFLFDESFRHELDTPKQIYQTADPCIWDAISTDWDWRLLFRSGDTFMRIANTSLPADAFRSSPIAQCNTLLTNALTSPGVVIAINGFVELTWSEIFSE